MYDVGKYVGSSGLQASNPKSYLVGLALHSLRSNSLLGLTKKVLSRIFRSLIYCQDTIRMYQLSAGIVPDRIQVSANQFAFRELDRGDLQEVAGAFAGVRAGEWLNAALSRFNRGHRAWGLVDGDHAIATVWSATDSNVSVTEVKHDFKVDADTIYFYGADTRPSYRGRGLYPYLLQRLCGVFSEKRKLIGAHSDNRSSIRGIVKVGFQLCDYLYQVRVMGIAFRGRKSAV